jgi:hypothetical protein
MWTRVTGDKREGESSTETSGSPRGRRAADLIRLTSIALIPALVGARMSQAWPDAGKEFYSTTSQVIATLFIAVTVDFFAGRASRRRAEDALLALVLIAEAWVGFFACVRALAGAQSAWTVGSAGAGVTAASVLVALALYDKIMKGQEDSHEVGLMGAMIVMLFLAAAVVLLMS